MTCYIFFDISMLQQSTPLPKEMEIQKKKVHFKWTVLGLKDLEYFVVFYLYNVMELLFGIVHMD